MRLFVAFLITDEVRGVLRSVQRKLSRFDRDVRWTPYEQMHVTVRFLGDVTDGDVPLLTEALTRAAGRTAPFRMDVGGCGCFPPRGPVRVIWVGAQNGSGTMDQVVEAVQEELEETGVPRETRPWTGHITIGRVRENRKDAALRDAACGMETGYADQRVESLALMSSVLSPRGATYSVVQTVSLG